MVSKMTTNEQFHEILTVYKTRSPGHGKKKMSESVDWFVYSSMSPPQEWGSKSTVWGSLTIRQPGLGN